MSTLPCRGGASARVSAHQDQAVKGVYRCRACGGIYNLYSGTVFEGNHLRPAQVVLLVRSVFKGEPTATMARELTICRQTALGLRRRLQAKGEQLQPTTPVSDTRTETDEVFQNAGEKR